MSKLYEDFFDEVLPYLPGCTTALAKLAIRNTIIDFCEGTLIIQRDHDPVTVLAGTIDYDFEPPTGYLVTRLMKAWYKGKELQPVAPDEIPSVQLYNASYPDAVKSVGDPQVITQKDERTYSLFPFPKDTAALALTMRVALKPTRSSTTVEDVIYEDYAEIIGYGAKYRLMSSPNKPYQDIAGAGLAKNLFDEGMNTARQRASRGYVRSDLRVQLIKV